MLLEPCSQAILAARGWIRLAGPIQPNNVVIDLSVFLRSTSLFFTTKAQPKVVPYPLPGRIVYHSQAV